MSGQKNAAKKIALVDTMFSRGDMGKIALQTMEREAKVNRWEILIVKKTVPGVKDIPVAMLRLLEQGCCAGIALGMPGKMPIDKQCSHEASLGIAQVQLMTRKSVLEVFVHEDEGENDAGLAQIMRDRASKHALNLLWMLFAPQELSKRAGSGERQGKENAKKLDL